MSEDTWSVPLSFFNFSLIVKDYFPNCQNAIPAFKCTQNFSHNIDLLFVFHLPSVAATIDLDLLYEYIDFFKEKEIHYDMNNKTSTNITEKYNPTVLIDESELLYINFKFQSILGDISIGS